jgi:sulfur-oxidizing protein SoxY
MTVLKNNSLNFINRRTLVRAIFFSSLPTICFSDESTTKKAIIEDFSELPTDDFEFDIELPKYVDTGKSIPFSINFPIVDNISYHNISVFSAYTTLNPNPRIFELKLLGNLPIFKFSSRIRLEMSQDLLFFAKLTSGNALLGRRHIDLSFGACDDLISDDPFRNGWMPKAKIAAPRSIIKGKPFEIRTVINHPMQSGLEYNVEFGGYPPTRIIEEFKCYANGVLTFAVDLDTAVSPNPYFSFFTQIWVDTEFSFEWIDTVGIQHTEEFYVKIDSY